MPFSFGDVLHSHGPVNSTRHTPRNLSQRRNSNKQSHHKDKTKNNKTSTRVLATKQKQKALKCKGVDVLEDDRWNVISRESTGKDSSVRNCDHGHYEFKVNIMPT